MSLMNSSSQMDPRARNLAARTAQRLPPYTPANLPNAPLAAASSPLSARSAAPPRPGTVATRFLLLSDTHNQPLFAQNDVEHAFKTPLPAADVLLHAGDLSNTGRYEQMRVTFDLVAAAPAPLKLVIAGNHDLTLDPEETPPIQRHTPTSAMRALATKERKAVRELWTGAEAQAAGIVYLDEGTHRFTLANGASLTIYTSPYSPEYYHWAFMYPHDEDRWNPARAPTGLMAGCTDKHTPKQPANPIPSFPDVDIVMTHGPAFQILDRVAAHHHVGCPHLVRALARARPRLHVCGHIHEDWGAMRVDWAHGTGEYLHVGTGEDEDVIGRGNVMVDLTGGKGKGKGDRGERMEQEDGSSERTIGEGELKWGTETLCINAAIMSRRFRPTNAPWVVDLLLPAAAAAAAAAAAVAAKGQEPL